MKLDIQIPSYYTEQNMFSSVSPWENFHLSVGSGKLLLCGERSPLGCVKKVKREQITLGSGPPSILRWSAKQA